MNRAQLRDVADWLVDLLLSSALIATLALFTMTLACATLKPAPLNVAALLVDARWGVLEACSVEWLSPEACVYAGDALTLADALVAQNVGEVGAAVRQSLVHSESLLPADSRLRPYLDALITLLAP